MKRLTWVYILLGVITPKNAGAELARQLLLDQLLQVGDKTVTFESGVSYSGSGSEHLYYSSITYRKATDLINTPIPFYTRFEVGAFADMSAIVTAKTTPQMATPRLALRVTLDQRSSTKTVNVIELPAALSVTG